MGQDRVYRVTLALGVQGSLEAPMQKASAAAAKTKQDIQRVNDVVKSADFQQIKTILADVGMSAANAFTGAVEKVGMFAMTLGAVAAGAGLAGIVYGVTHLNAEAEKLQISLGTIFQANGAASSMADGMELAGSIMKDIRKDAAALPGEAEDLIGIFRSISIPGLRAGATPKQLEHLAANIMASGAVAGLDQAMVAREAGQLMAGRAGSHNVLGQRLFGLQGDAAQKFNTSSAADRMKFLEEGMAKYGESIAFFNNTFDAQWSSLVDHIKNTGRDATKPLFESVKKTLADINGWLDKNEDKVAAVTKYVGDGLAKAWDYLVGKATEFGPLLVDFFAQAHGEALKIWDAIAPVAHFVERQAKNFLGDPHSIDKLHNVLKLYAAVKLGSMALPVAGTVSSALGPTGMLAGAGIGAGEAAAVALPVFAEAAILVGGAALAFKLLNDETSVFYRKARQDWAGTIYELQAAWGELTHAFREVYPELKFIGDAVGEEFLRGLHNTAQGIHVMASAIDWLATRIHDFIDTIPGASKFLAANAGGAGGDVGWGGIHQDLKKATDEFTKVSGSDGGLKAAAAGRANMQIQKVEIIVSSNQDPGRIAELVTDKLSRVGRHPRVSSSRRDLK